MANNQPPEYLLPILHDIEITVVQLFEEFPGISDKDIEWAYNELRIYFQQRAKGKEPEEPLSNADSKQALIDEILNTLEIREEEELDAHLVYSLFYMPGGYQIPNVASVYGSAMNYLRRSARFWRKEDGPRGYVQFIKQMTTSDPEDNL